MTGAMLFAELAEAFSHYLIWSGLFALLLAPAVLARTRWSESPPLLICVSLSVFAHLLLTIYAYATRLPHGDTGPGRGGDTPGEVVIALQMLDEADALADAAANTVAASTAAAEAAPDAEAADDADAQAASRPASPAAADQPADSTAAMPSPLEELLPEQRSDAAAASAEPDSVVDPSIADRAADAPAPPAAPSPVMPPTAPAQDRASANALAAADATVESREPLATPPDISPAIPTATTPDMVTDMVTAMATPPPMDQRRADAAPVPLAYRNRHSNRRFEAALRQGGSAETEAAVESALDWLATQQSPEGVWAAASTGAGREARVLGQDRGGAGAHADAGLTALALLAFLGAGETHLDGPRRPSVQHGLEYLLRIQRADGELAGSADLFARMYCHGMATLAISEAYALTGDARLRPALDAAVGYTIRAQDPNGGGWRYRPGDSGDTSQFGWQLMSLKSAQLAGVPIPTTVWDRARKFLRSVSSGSDAGLASYRSGERPSRTMTAEALFCRVLLDDSQPAQAREALRFVAQEPPGVGPDNHYYWYYGTLAQFQMQSDSWRIWNESLQRQLLARQHGAGPLRGSWDPDAVWGTHGGRVFSTALSALSLEVYYRYLPLYQTARAGSR